MRNYEDPRSYVQRHLEQAADRYTEGLRRSGLRPSARLTRAMAGRALREAQEHYIRDITELRDRRIAGILRNQKEDLNAIKREGASFRLKTCPPIALLFGGVAWYNFHQPGGFFTGVLFASFALTFLAFLVLGAIFDRSIK